MLHEANIEFRRLIPEWVSLVAYTTELSEYDGTLSSSVRHMLTVTE